MLNEDKVPGILWRKFRYTHVKFTVIDRESGFVDS